MMRAEGTVGLPPDATPEQRFAFLQEQIEWLRKRIQATELAVDTERDERANAIKIERGARKSGDSEVREQVRRLGMGGVDLSFLGAFWLGCGIIFATIPEKLAAWFCRTRWCENNFARHHGLRRDHHDRARKVYRA